MHPRDEKLLELLMILQKKGDVCVTVISGVECCKYTGVIDQIFDDCYLVLDSGKGVKIYIPIDCIYKIIYYIDDHQLCIFERN
jgi:hypothetical protein